MSKLFKSRTASVSIAVKADPIPRALPMPRFDYQRSSSQTNSAQGNATDHAKEGAAKVTIKSLQNLRVA